MDDVSLERIRRKVESGERLTAPELERLRDAARAQPGPTLRLAVAHALINAEENPSALLLLERLVRDHPRDLQSWLGLARVLLALDRTGEAERALRMALGLSPADPEALKALALLALRRGEFERARVLVGDVLRRDPFDDEAKLIRAELETPDPSNPPEPVVVQPIALRPEFTRRLLRMLKARGIPAAKEGDRLLFRVEGGEVTRVDLASLYEGYLVSGGPLETEVRRIIDGLVQASGLPGSREGLLERVLPVLRPGGFTDTARGALHREGPAGVSIFYVIEDPELVRYLPSGVVEGFGLSLEQIDLAAFEALAARPAPVQRIGEDVWAVCAGDGHDPARLLTAPTREAIRCEVGGGPWRVDLGRREAAFLCRLNDPRGNAALEAVNASPDGLPGRFVLDEDGALRRMD